MSEARGEWVCFFILPDRKSAYVPQLDVVFFSDGTKTMNITDATLQFMPG